MAGKRVDLSSLASAAPAEVRVPRIAHHGSRSVLLEQVAANPLNTRVLDPDSPKIREISDSIRKNGQLQACTVVTLTAFLKIYPEFEDSLGNAEFVQVTGGRRRLALLLLGETMDISVKDDLAESRVHFVSATAAENLDRQDYDAIEEARAIELIITESGSATAAAERMSRTRAWVTQRMNLLKLTPEVQNAIRSDGVPLRDVRKLHTYPPEEQMDALRTILKRKAAVDKAAEAEPGESSIASVPEPRSAPTVMTAVRRLGATPPLIAESLKAALPPDDLRALAQLLLADE
jgi:ParB family transcriptional regulator, chromosome partitioning protein